MRTYYIEFEGRMYRIEKDKKLEDRLLHTSSEDLPDEKIKEILSSMVQ